MKAVKIIGIRVNDRIKEAGRTQKVLSTHAGIINLRLGFHELNDYVCSRTGFLILHLKGNPDDWKNLEKDLGEIGGIDVKQMNFKLN